MGGLHDFDLARTSRSPQPARYEGHHRRDQSWSIIERQRQIFSWPVQLREHSDIGNVTSRPQESAGGFVDFLLGRGARNTRCYRLAFEDRHLECAFAESIVRLILAAPPSASTSIESTEPPPLLELLRPQQSNFCRHRAWCFTPVQTR